MPGSDLSALLAPLRARPEAAAILLDIDGTLAPIVERPEDASVPQRASNALRAMAGPYGLVACISGRRATDARRLVGVEEIAYAGNHGLERLDPGGDEAAVDDAVRERAAAVGRFVAEREGRIGEAGLRLEDKGPIQALHWRGAADEDAAEAAAETLATEAIEGGLAVHRGRKVLEIRPTDAIDKGRAVGTLLDGRGIEAALYAGDDRTDLDAFRALRELREAGGLADAVCVGISSAEGPPELGETADALVSGTEELADLLEELAAEA